jgi:energy-coupling factor transporter ATP-binding protein EcfA2
MRLITNVRIRGLRSIQNQALQEVASLTVLVGKNSSGKSNVLRALNLFFNGEVEPGKPLLLGRDFHSRPQARRKKEVVVAVDFALPPGFNFRKSLASLKNALSENFTIEKLWELDVQGRTVENVSLLVGGTPVPNGGDFARQFLNLITFRYIPNRTVPSALLREESRIIANSMFAKTPAGAGAQSLIDAVQSAAERLLRRASESMVQSGAPLRELGIASPQSVADMLSVSGFQARGQHGEVVRDEEWGSGNQAFFLYEVLQAVDTNYSRSFGWKQAAVWGVEEPESGLHRDLETRLAEELRVWSRDQALKMQIIQTTHSPIFTMAADRGYWIELVDGASAIKGTAIPKLVKDAERRGVSGWVQPILAFPSNPVILVEGQIDAEVLSHVAQIANKENLRFLALPELDAAEKRGGKDSMITYIQRHGGLIPNRPSDAPLLLLFDWEVTDAELNKARTAYGANGQDAILRMNSAHAPLELGEEFTGIERFYPSAVVDAGAAAGEFILGKAPGQPWSISKAQFEAAKPRLRQRVLAVTDPNELAPLLAVIQEIDLAVGAISSAQLSLPVR